MIEEYIRMQELAEEKREQEKIARAEKIQKLMDRMGDVVKKGQDAEKQYEMRLLRDALKKDKEAEAEEKRRKMAYLHRNQEVNRELAKQV